MAKRVTSSEYCPPLIISAHGIRTNGQWQKTFAAVVSGKPSKVESYDYGRYGLLRFLAPGVNSRMIDHFYDWYSNTIRGCPEADLDRFDKRPCLVAHSFGTWIVGHAMLKYEDIRFDKMILCGSILSTSFAWSTLFARDQVAAVRNECGPKDPWPKWAERLVSAAGPSGSKGFEWFGPAVENCFYDDFHHDEFYRRPHMEKHWLPFLRRSPSPLMLLHGRDVQDVAEMSRIFDVTGDVIDTEVYGRLEHYEEVEIPNGMAVSRAKINPDIWTFIIDRQSRRPAGYINAMPVDDSTYEEIRSGRVFDNGISPSGIVPYVPNQTVRVYLMSIAIAEQDRRWGDGLFQGTYVQLMNGLLYKLIYYAKNHSIRVSHFLATAWTPEGRKMCDFFGMTQIGCDSFGDPIFGINLRDLKPNDERKLPPTLRHLLAVYHRSES